MPRVIRKRKINAGAASYHCRACAEPIGVGDEYYQWSFRYGGTHRQHVAHGYPKQSQLTQSKMSEVYAAQEDLESFTSGAESLEEYKQDAVSALQDARDIAQSVAYEYQDAIDAMPASEAENQERIDAIEDWTSTLEDAVDDIENIDEGEPGPIGPDDLYDDPFQAKREEIDNIVQHAAGEFSY